MSNSKTNPDTSGRENKPEKGKYWPGDFPAKHELSDVELNGLRRKASAGDPAATRELHAYHGTPVPEWAEK